MPKIEEKTWFSRWVNAKKWKIPGECHDKIQGGQKIDMGGYKFFLEKTIMWSMVRFCKFQVLVLTETVSNFMHDGSFVLTSWCLKTDTIDSTLTDWRMTT